MRLVDSSFIDNIMLFFIIACLVLVWRFSNTSVSLLLVYAVLSGLYMLHGAIFVKDLISLVRSYLFASRKMILFTMDF